MIAILRRRGHIIVILLVPQKCSPPRRKPCESSCDGKSSWRASHVQVAVSKRTMCAFELFYCCVAIFAWSIPVMRPIFVFCCVRPCFNKGTSAALGLGTLNLLFVLFVTQDGLKTNYVLKGEWPSRPQKLL